MIIPTWSAVSVVFTVGEQSRVTGQPILSIEGDNLIDHMSQSREKVRGSLFDKVSALRARSASNHRWTKHQLALSQFAHLMQDLRGTPNDDSDAMALQMERLPRQWHRRSSSSILRIASTSIKTFMAITGTTAQLALVSRRCHSCHQRRRTSQTL